MRKFLITLRVIDNGKKINAIRDLRGATGMGLREAKEFVEGPGYHGGELIVNATQVALLCSLEMRPSPSFGESEQPDFIVTTCKEIAPPAAVDISSQLV